MDAKDKGVAGMILDGMDGKTAGPPAVEPSEDDMGGDQAAQESAAEDFAAAVKAGNGPGIVAALKELLGLIGV